MKLPKAGGLVSMSFVFCAVTLLTGQEAAPQIQAQAAIRAGRPAQAVALLQRSVDDNTADAPTRLVYVVALIADDRVETAETQIARLEAGRMATDAQLTALKSSVGRIKAAKAVSNQIAPLVQAGDVRAALKTLDASATNTSGSVFARSYLRRLLGDFAGAAEVVSRAQQASTGATAAEFGRALAAVKEQQTSFQQAKDIYVGQAVKSFPSALSDGWANKASCPGFEGGVVFGDDKPEYVACAKQYIESTSRAGQTLFDLAPFSQEAISARLMQAIWFGKEAEALDIVRRSKRTHQVFALPSYVYPDVADGATGLLVFDLNTRQMTWLDGDAKRYRDPKTKTPAHQSRLPLAEVKDFSQEVEAFVTTYTSGARSMNLRKAVAFKTRGAAWGGVALAEDFLKVFGEVPLRLAMRTYGKVVAEILLLPENKYSLADEQPKRGGLFTGMAWMAVAGLAASQGNTTTVTQASELASTSLLNRSAAMDRDAAVKEAWELEMSSVTLAVDARAIQTEIDGLLANTLVVSAPTTTARSSPPSAPAPSPASPPASSAASSPASAPASSPASAPAPPPALAPPSARALAPTSAPASPPASSAAALAPASSRPSAPTSAPPPAPGAAPASREAAVVTPASPFVRFTSTGATVIDRVTRLEWAGQDSGTPVATWNQARDYCDRLSMDGADDWRLPTGAELIALFQAVQGQPVQASREGYKFRSVPGVQISSPYFWSGPASSLPFNFGMTTTGLDLGAVRALCVR